MENPLAETALTGMRASIIIVSYNALHETTAPCLESIFELTDYPDYEVIVVDNSSSDGTPEYLTRLSAREPRLKCILNSTNRGFAGGNNDALSAASGRFLVLLNNDTRVTRGWLGKFVRLLEGDPGIGLVGPVSNATGNEQEIFTQGSTPEEIAQEGGLWLEAGCCELVPMERVCFFCVATRRDVVARVGGLDEAYGLGFYEDDDYCLRAKNAGYRLVLCEDVFIYHRGSASFDKVPDITKKLMKRNRKLLESKFGLGRYHTRHPRQRYLELIASCLERLKSLGPDRELQYKIENRFRKVEGLRPRGFFKKVLFDRQVHRLKRVFNACIGG